MKFHENRLLADISHEIAYLIFSILGNMPQKLSSATVVLSALRVKATCMDAVQHIQLNCILQHSSDLCYSD